MSLGAKAHIPLARRIEEALEFLRYDLLVGNTRT